MTTKMSSDNLDRDHCPKCGIAMTDCADYRAENERLRAALSGIAGRFELLGDGENVGKEK